VHQGVSVALSGRLTIRRTWSRARLAWCVALVASTEPYPTAMSASDSFSQRMRRTIGVNGMGGKDADAKNHKERRNNFKHGAALTK
jgi:hypothetical protein